MNTSHSSFVKLFEQSIKDNWDLQALADYKGASFFYKEVANRIDRLHLTFEACGVERGDKIAIIGKNSAYWGIAYLATVTYGAVIVPLLPDFPCESVQNLVNHSDSVFLFAGDSLCKKFMPETMPNVRTILSLEDFSFLYSAEAEVQDKVTEALAYHLDKYPDGVLRDNVFYEDVSSEMPAVISYTSGTTGVSKGVVLPHRSLLGNMLFAQNNMPLKAGDSIVSFLPSAHMYGCAFEFLFPFTIGCNITFLTRTPSPAVVLAAFAEIKPALILSVPLVIDKIYKKKIKPMLSKPYMKLLKSIPVVNKIIYRKVRESVYESFGGNFTELVIGGAAFNPEAERFFRKIKLPFTVGYGMTECGPLIAYASWDTTVLGASGRAVDALEVKIDSSDQQKEIGEIVMRGSQVMLGYYKNDEETKKVIDEDGWFHSGDLGVIDEHGNIHIKGRKKTMLLSSSGKNVYPDEIEAIVNAMPMVLETVVVLRAGLLVAIVVPDEGAMASKGKTNDDLASIYKGYLSRLNKKLPKYMQVSKFEVRLEEFDKTPKHSIKRFLYK